MKPQSLTSFSQVAFVKCVPLFETIFSGILERANTDFNFAIIVQPAKFIQFRYFDAFTQVINDKQPFRILEVKEVKAKRLPRCIWNIMRNQWFMTVLFLVFNERRAILNGILYFFIHHWPMHSLLCSIFAFLGAKVQIIYVFEHLRFKNLWNRLLIDSC